MTKNSYIVENPVLLILYNRPNYTEQLINQIKKVQPSNLYIFIDSHPDGDDENNVKKIKEVKNLIENEIKWNCNKSYNYPTYNLGPSKGPKTAIDWFFNNEKQGIILEDDCIPSISFFKFCDELLEKYKKNKKIKIISGDNGSGVLPMKYFEGKDYSYTSLPLIWGWASWEDTWREYSSDLGQWSRDINYSNKLKNYYIADKLIVKNIFKRILKHEDYKNRFWDFQLFSSILENEGVCIIPQKNLVSNIGFGENSTNTKKINYRSNATIYEIKTITHLTEVKNIKRNNRILLNTVHVGLNPNFLKFFPVFLLPLFYLYKRTLYFLSKINVFRRKV